MTITVNGPVLDRLQELAEKTGETIDALVLMAVRRFLDTEAVKTIMRGET